MENPRRYHTLHLSDKEVRRYRPSTWPSSATPTELGGAPHTYGLRPRGSYIVDLDDDRIIPFEVSSPSDILDVTIDGIPISEYIGDPLEERFAYTVIASAASPGGLHMRKKRGSAKGKYVVLPSVTENIDIVYGRLALSVYGIAVPHPSPRTIVRTNIVLLNAEQARLLDASEFKHGNYRIARYEMRDAKGVCTYLLEPDGRFSSRIRTLAYEGISSGLEIGKDTYLALTVQATHRKVRIIEATMDHYFSEVFHLAKLDEKPITVDDTTFAPDCGNRLFLELREIYEQPEMRSTCRAIVDEINTRLAPHFSKQTLRTIGVETVLDPYMIGSDGRIAFDDVTAVIREYDPETVYADFRLSESL